MSKTDRVDVERLYRAIADREPTAEILHMVWEMYNRPSYLRPPEDEMRLARNCGTVRAHG